MQRLSRSTIGLCRRSSVGFIGSAPPRWWPPALARRDTPLMAAASALPNQHLDHLSRFSYGPWSMQHYIGVKSVKKLCKRGYTTMEVKPSNPMEEMSGTKDDTESNPMRRPTEEVTESNNTADDMWDVIILNYSSHRDGTIYKKSLYWENNYFVDITDRNETRLEPMRFSVATNCNPDPENCEYHWPCEMVQIFSLKLAKTPINSGSIQLYGYIAARDDVDSMLNYVFYRSRDDPIIVQKDSLIEMTGPKRGIALVCDVLFEFDMRIKNGEQEEDDLQLIDGVIKLYAIRMLWTPFTLRIHGNSGAVDMCLTNVWKGVEATVEVAISGVENGFDLSLSCVLSMCEVRKEFQLFGGTIRESCGLRRFVIAVLLDTVMHLKFKVDHSSAEHCCSFEAKLHGCASHQIKLELASILVKVTWSTLIK